MPTRRDRAKLNRRLIGWYVEFWKMKRRKLALEPIFVSAMLKSALLKLPLVASAGLLRPSRAPVAPNCENSGGGLKKGNFPGGRGEFIFVSGTMREARG